MLPVRPFSVPGGGISPTKPKLNEVDPSSSSSSLQPEVVNNVRGGGDSHRSDNNASSGSGNSSNLSSKAGYASTSLDTNEDIDKIKNKLTKSK